MLQVLGLPMLLNTGMLFAALVCQPALIGKAQELVYIPENSFWIQIGTIPLLQISQMRVDQFTSPGSIMMGLPG